MLPPSSDTSSAHRLRDDIVSSERRSVEIPKARPELLSVVQLKAYSVSWSRYLGLGQRGHRNAGIAGWVTGELNAVISWQVLFQFPSVPRNSLKVLIRFSTRLPSGAVDRNATEGVPYSA